MTTYIALLRAINLAGKNRVSMSDLRALCGTIGMQNAQTLLQSGNLVFQSDLSGAATLEKLLENATGKHLKVNTDFMIRTAKEWKAIVEANPFPSEARRDPGHLLLICMKAAPDRAAVTALQKAITGPEVVRCVGRELYVTYPDGVGRSKLTNALMEKKLGTSGTGRNWNTVLKLAALTATGR